MLLFSGYITEQNFGGQPQQILQYSSKAISG